MPNDRLSEVIHSLSCSKAAPAFSRFNAHSHTIASLHPSAIKARWFSSSLWTLRANFSAQKSSRVEGVVANLQPGCRCQKQPFTSIAARHLGRTMSGLPGNRPSCRRKRNPDAWRARRTSSSGLVFCPLMPAIIRDRVVLSTMSVMWLFSLATGVRPGMRRPRLTEVVTGEKCSR